MAELVRGVDAARVRANLAAVRERIAAAGTDPDAVQIVAATKYVAVEEMGALADGGVTVAGENRLQDLQAKHAAYGDRFAWEFIGHLQSRKLAQVAPLVRRIHSVSTDSVLDRLRRHADVLPDGLEILVEVNVAGEEGKDGVAPADLDAFLERCPIAPVGLMTMPPRAERPENSRRWFAALAQLAADRGLPQLSMGTTQDFEVAVQEGATIVRLGSVLVREQE